METNRHKNEQEKYKKKWYIYLTKNKNIFCNKKISISNKNDNFDNVIITNILKKSIIYFGTMIPWSELKILFYFLF